MLTTLAVSTDLAPSFMEDRIKTPTSIDMSRCMIWCPCGDLFLEEKTVFAFVDFLLELGCFGNMMNC